MKVQEQIKEYIKSQPEPKRSDMQALHLLTLQVLPNCKLWFLDGKNSEDKTVSNPNIGYGSHTIKYADGTTREFYQIGFSANKTGISVYILGIKDKKYLSASYGQKLGKASVTGYCIKFKTLKDINTGILEAAIRDGVAGKMKTQFDTTDEYIATFPADVQRILKKLRQTVKKAAPEAVEAISYQMPTFKLDGKNLVHFAAFKNHIGFYPTPSGTAMFKKEIARYKSGKGSIQFLLDEPLPYDLVTRIVEFRLTEELAAAKKKKGK